MFTNKTEKYNLTVHFLNKVWESMWTYSSAVKQVYTLSLSLLYHRQKRQILLVVDET